MVGVERVGPYRFIQGEAQRVTTDSLLLADFVLPLMEGESVVDLGTGAGIIPVVLAWKTCAGRIVGVEVDGAAAETARKNVEGNALSGRITVLEGDYRGLFKKFPEGSFSVVVGNPPYMRAGSGRVSPKGARAGARSEVHGGLRDLVAVSRHLAGRTGRVCYVFPVRRLAEMLSELDCAGLKARRLKFVHTGPGREAKLFLIEAGTTGSLRVEEPVVL